MAKAARQNGVTIIEKCPVKKIITKNNPQAKSMQAEKTFQLTYKTVAESNGKKFPRSVRVVASLKGRILRISSSK